MINKATTLDCLEELKNLGSLITLIAKATPDATLSSDIESCAGLGFAPIFPDTCYHLTHYWPAAADIPVA
ncbi:hypothetical protein U4Y86_25670, partial [Escherichia coli]|nr:hypothetical protein [Escherichia coli]